MKNSDLELRKNGEFVNQHAEKIVDSVITFFANNERKWTCQGINIGFPEIAIVSVVKVITLDYGWVDSLNKRKLENGESLEKILQEKSNKSNYSDETHIKCETTKKNQELLRIEIHFLGREERSNYLVVDHANKIIPCAYAEMHSHNWDNMSSMAIRGVQERNWRSSSDI